MDRHGFNPTFTITDRVAAALTTIERARGFLDAAMLSDEWVQSMSERAFLLEAHHTTHIEGTELTLEQSKRLLAGEQLPETNPDDARELLNYRDAFEFVAEYVQGDSPINEGLIREIHKRLVEGVRGGSAAPGEYRRVQNYVVNAVTQQVVYEPPPAYDVPILMGELASWLNEEGKIHPILVSGVAQFQLVHIHPFLDGNGRASRLLSTLCLYRAGYDFKRLFTISEYYDRNRSAFYKAIQSVRENNMDMTGWLEYFADGLATQLSEVRQRGEQTIRRDILAKKFGLSERQSLALRHVLEHGDLAIQDYEELCPGVNRRTLQRDLKGMIDKGLLSERGTSPTDPTKRYQLAEGIL